MGDEKKFIEAAKAMIERHKNTFQSLAEKDTLEYDLAQWVLQHKEGLHDKIAHLHRPNNHLFPETLQEIYFHQYEEAVLDVLKKEISESFNLDPETLTSRVTKQFISSIAQDLLDPKKELVFTKKE